MMARSRGGQMAAAITLAALLSLATASSDLLLVVGTVTSTTARILYQPLSPMDTLTYAVTPSGPAIGTGSSASPSASSSAALSGAVNATDALVSPRVLALSNLSPGTFYHVAFKTPSSVHVAKFHTFGDQSEGVRTAIVSCNRLNEDNDTSMWERFRDEVTAARDVTLHLGDQVYVDWLVRDLRAIVDRGGDPGSDAELEQMFRDVYRRVWGDIVLQSVLRVGSHVMTPDDHEFVDNFDAHYYTGKYRRIMCAARKVYYEYQYQLVADIIDPITQEESVDVKNDKVYNFFRIGNTAFLMLDLRIQRATAGHAEHPLLGPHQFAAFMSSLSSYASDPTIARIIVTTAVPLLYSNEFLAQVVYTVEGERMPMHPDMQRESLALLDALSEHSEKVILVAGDIHMHLDTVLTNNRNNRQLRQLASSGMTKGSTVGSKFKLFAFHLVLVKLSTRSVQHWSFDHERAFLFHNFVTLNVTSGGELTYEAHFAHLSPTQKAVEMVFDHIHSIIAVLAIVILRRLANRTRL